MEELLFGECLRSVKELLGHLVGWWRGDGRGRLGLGAPPLTLKDVGVAMLVIRTT